jgi:biopolymer transport protein ExbB
MNSEIKPVTKPKTSNYLAFAVIPLAFIVSLLLFKFVLGNPVNFMGGNPENNPLPGNYLGIIYKGGVIVPILMTLLLVVLTFCIERFITIGKSRGKGSIDSFLNEVRTNIASGNLDAVYQSCERQKGSLANVVKAGLDEYRHMANDKTLEKEQKILTIQKSIEETTSLELPMLSKNLSIISTIASIATLIGLLGTVLGMIKAFAAMATAGAPDAVQLANGISEALINTALGIGGSTIAIIFYNYFITKIDSITYGIDEAGYSIVQSFSSKY